MAKGAKVQINMHLVSFQERGISPANLNDEQSAG